MLIPPPKGVMYEKTSLKVWIGDVWPISIMLSATIYGCCITQLSSSCLIHTPHSSPTYCMGSVWT